MSLGTTVATFSVVALVVWGAAAAVGVSALLTASQLAYDVLRFAGAAYLGPPREPSPRGSRTARPGRRPGRDWRPTCSTPKVGVFYVALLPQFLPAGANPLAVGCCSPACTH